jgi:hypothetical protein
MGDFTSVVSWWNLLDGPEKEEVREWLADRRHQFPDDPGRKQVQVGLIAAGDYVGEPHEAVVNWLQHHRASLLIAGVPSILSPLPAPPA